MSILLHGYVGLYRCFYFLTFCLFSPNLLDIQRTPLHENKPTVHRLLLITLVKLDLCKMQIYFEKYFTFQLINIWNDLWPFIPLQIFAHLPTHHYQFHPDDQITLKPYKHFKGVLVWTGQMIFVILCVNFHKSPDMANDLDNFHQDWAIDMRVTELQQTNTLLWH